MCKTHLVFLLGMPCHRVSPYIYRYTREVVEELEREETRWRRLARLNGFLVSPNRIAHRKFAFLHVC